MRPEDIKREIYLAMLFGCLCGMVIQALFDLIK